MCFQCCLDHTDYVKHFCMNCMKVNIVSKWMKYDETRKSAIQRFAMEYIANNINVTTTTQIHSQDNLSIPSYVMVKFAEVFVEIMKRQWPQRWSNLYDELTAVMRKSSSQFYTGVMIFEFLLQEITDDSSSSRLAESRRHDLQSVALPSLLHRRRSTARETCSSASFSTPCATTPATTAMAGAISWSAFVSSPSARRWFSPSHSLTSSCWRAR